MLTVFRLLVIAQTVVTPSSDQSEHLFKSCMLAYPTSPERMILPEQSHQIAQG